MTNGVIENINITSSGSGYTNAPTVIIDAPVTTITCDLSMVPGIQLSGGVGKTNIISYFTETNTNWTELGDSDLNK